MTTVSLYRNKRNHNKYIEVHNDGHYHNAVVQYIRHTLDEMIAAYPPDKAEALRKYYPDGLKQRTGDRRLHRWKIKNLNELLTDYEEVH